MAPGAARHAEATAALPASRAGRAARAEAERLDPGGTDAPEKAERESTAAQAAWRSRREAAIAEVAAAREGVDAARRALAEAEVGEAGAPCPVCGRPLGPEAGAWRSELAARVADAEDRLRRAKAEPGPEPPELAVLAGRLRAASLRAEAAAAPDPDAVAAEIAATAEDANRARALAGSERRFSDAEAGLARAEKTVERAGATAGETAEALKATGFADPEAARAALARAASAGAAATGAATALRTAQAALGSATRAAEAAEARLREARERREALRRARHEETLQGAVAGEMRALRTTLNGALRPDLEARAGELLERMTAGRYRRVRLSPEFEPTLVDEETDRAVLSGGEEDVVALALRLALAELVQDRGGHALTLLLLDEAFGALDAERRQSLLDVLAGLRDRYAQVVVVTHIEDVAQVADRVLRVTRDATGAARVAEG